MIPTFGIIAVACATFAFVVLKLAAYRIDPFPYEYRRLRGILATIGIIVCAGSQIDISLLADLALKLALLAAFLLTLWPGGLFTADERSALVE